MSKKTIIFDLDDTLYKEIDFVKSGYRYIAEQFCSLSPQEDIYQRLFNSYLSGGNAFAELNEYLGIQLPISDFLSMYRCHFPQIALTRGCEEVLVKLIENGWDIGIISDGRSITQRNKIKALGLQNYVHADMVVISEEFGTEKPSEANYQYFTKNNRDCKVFVYVGDNVKKDFITPNKLGWYTIGVRDDGNNIHKTIIMLEEYQPKVWINDIAELSDALDSLGLK